MFHSGNGSALNGNVGGDSVVSRTLLNSMPPAVKTIEKDPSTLSLSFVRNNLPKICYLDNNLYLMR